MRAVPCGSKVWVDMSCIWMYRRGLGSIFLSITPISDNTRWFVSWWGLQSSCQHHIVVLWGKFPMDRKFEWIWAVYECIEEGWGVFFCLAPPEVTIQGDLCPDEMVFLYIGVWYYVKVGVMYVKICINFFQNPIKGPLMTSCGSVLLKFSWVGDGRWQVFPTFCPFWILWVPDLVMCPRKLHGLSHWFRS